jgi:hypothetical protein
MFLEHSQAGAGSTLKYTYEPPDNLPVLSMRIPRGNDPELIVKVIGGVAEGITVVKRDANKRFLRNLNLAIFGPSPRSQVVPHEMGHVFGLFHTRLFGNLMCSADVLNIAPATFNILEDFFTSLPCSLNPMFDFKNVFNVTLRPWQVQNAIEGNHCLSLAL